MAPFLLGKTPFQSRKKIGWVPQSFHFDKNFPISVFEVVLQGTLKDAPWFGGYHKKNKDDAEAMLEKMGMNKIEHHPFSDLSGGQRQRVLLARALVSNPEILLLDEATSGVDKKTQEEIYHFLSTLKEITILMVTHDLEAIVNRSTRFSALKKI